MVDSNKAQSKEGKSDIDENLEELTRSDEELCAAALYLWFSAHNLIVQDLFRPIKMQMPTVSIQRWLMVLTPYLSCIHHVRILYLLIFIEVFLSYHMLQLFLNFM